jgi:hypothetical protein
MVVVVVVVVVVVAAVVVAEPLSFLSPLLFNRLRTPATERRSVCPVCRNARRIFDAIVCILCVTMHFVLHICERC